MKTLTPYSIIHMIILFYFISVNHSFAQESNTSRIVERERRESVEIHTPELGIKNQSDRVSDDIVEIESLQTEHDEVESIDIEEGDLSIQSIGGSWGSQVTVASGGFNQRGVNSIVDNNNNIYVAIEDYQLYYTRIIIYRSTNNGQSWSWWATVTDGTNSISFPSIAYSNGNIFVLYWKQNGSQGLYRRNISSGTTSSLNLPSPSSNLIRARLISDARYYATSAYLYYAYLVARTDGDADLWFARSTTDGASWDQHQFIATVSNSYIIADVGMDYSLSSGLFISYLGVGTNRNKLMMRKSTNDGVSWSSSIVIDDWQDDSFGPVVAAHGNNILIVFQERWDGRIEDIIGVRSTDGGNNWSRYYIDFSDNNQILPWVTHDINGNFYVTYQSNGRIYALIGNQSPVVSNPVQINSTTNASNDDYTAIVGFSSLSGAAAAWVGGSPGSYNVYSNSYLSADPRGNISFKINNVEGGGEGLPGNYGRVELYNSTDTKVDERQTVNGVATFSEIPIGSGYYAKVYHNPNPPTIHGEEFWGERRNITIQSGNNGQITFQRNMPYGANPRVYINSTNEEVTWQTVSPGTELRVEYKVKYPPDGDTSTRSIRGRLVLDRDKSWSYDIDRSTDTKSVSRGDSTVISEIITLQEEGDYYFTVGVRTAVVGPGYIITDGWMWSEEPLVKVEERVANVSGLVHSSKNTFDIISGAEVSIANKSAITDWEGKYHISDVPIGFHSISISDPHNRYNWENESYTLNVEGDIHNADFLGTVRANASIDITHPENFVPGEPIDITISLVNTAFALSNVEAYLDISFPQFNMSAPPVEILNVNGFLWPESFEKDQIIFKVDQTTGTRGEGPAEHLLISAKRVDTIHFNNPYSYTVRVTLPENWIEDFVIYVKGSIGDNRDPSYGHIGQQGLWESVYRITGYGFENIWTNLSKDENIYRAMMQMDEGHHLLNKVLSKDKYYNDINSIWLEKYGDNVVIDDHEYATDLLQIMANKVIINSPQWTPNTLNYISPTNIYKYTDLIDNDNNQYFLFSVFDIGGDLDKIRNPSIWNPEGTDYYESRYKIYKKVINGLLYYYDEEQYINMFTQYSNTISKLSNAVEKAATSEEIKDIISKIGGYDNIGQFIESSDGATIYLNKATEFSSRVNSVMGVVNNIQSGYSKLKKHVIVYFFLTELTGIKLDVLYNIIHNTESVYQDPALINAINDVRYEYYTKFYLAENGDWLDMVQIIALDVGNAVFDFGIDLAKKWAYKATTNYFSIWVPKAGLKAYLVVAPWQAGFSLMSARDLLRSSILSTNIYYLIYNAQINRISLYDDEYKNIKSLATAEYMRALSSYCSYNYVTQYLRNWLVTIGSWMHLGSLSEVRDFYRKHSRLSMEGIRKRTEPWYLAGEALTYDDYDYDQRWVVQKLSSQPNYAELITIPARPEVNIEFNKIYVSTFRAESNHGYPLEYQYEWGDGTHSHWGGITREYEYNSAGQYNVRVRAKSTVNPDVISDWSSITSIDIYNQESISQPNPPQGPSQGIVNELLTFSVSGASSSQEHELEYLFYWGDGNISNWGDVYGNHIYNEPGVYLVYVIARCKYHTEYLSDWSNSKEIIIEFLENNILTVSPEQHDVPYISGTVTYQVANNGIGNMEWTASSNQDWAQITSGSSGVNDGTIEVSYTYNESPDTRTTTITVEAPGAGGSPQEVKIVQYGTSSVGDREWIVYNTSNSNITSNNIYSLAIDNSDHLWIGTWGDGIGYYNGTEWISYNTENSGLHDNYVRGLAVNNDDEIWIGTGEDMSDSWGGVAHYDRMEWTIYNADNSNLPNDWIRAVAVDISNNVWFGTAGGLAKYNGQDWTTFNTLNSGIIHNYVVAIEISDSDEIWVGTDGGGLSMYDGVNWTNFTTSNSNLPSNYITSIRFIDNNTIAIGTNNGGLAIFDGSVWEVYNDSNSPLPSNFVTSISPDISSGIWIGTDNGLSFYDENEWYIFNSSNSILSSNYINALEMNKRGDLWIGCWEGGILKVVSPLDVEKPLLDVTPTQIYLTGTSGVIELAVSNEGGGDMDWVASSDQEWAQIISGSSGVNDGIIEISYTSNESPDQRIATITVEASGAEGSPIDVKIVQAGVPDAQSWTTYNTNNSELPSNEILSLALDTNGHVWIGTFGEYDYEESIWTGGGLAKFDGSNWTVYDPNNSDIPSNQLNSLVFDVYGNLWIGSNWGGITKYDGAAFTTYNRFNSGLPQDDVHSLAIDKNNHLWIGTLGGLAKYDGDSWSVYTELNSGLPHDYVWSLAIDDDNNVWIGTWEGLTKFDGTQWTVFNTTNSNIPHNSVMCVEIDNNGKIWAGTYSGLVEYDGVNWVVHNVSQSEYPGIIRALAVEQSNYIWAGMLFTGLAKYNHTDWTYYTTTNSGLPDGRVRSIIIDEVGNKWIGTVNGLAKYNDVQLQLPDSPLLYIPTNTANMVGITPRLSWQKIDDADSYRINVTDNNSFNLDVIDIPDSNFIVTDLEHETEYQWKVRAWNESGYSEWSETYTFTTISPPQAEETKIAPVGDNSTVDYDSGLQFTGDVQTASDVTVQIYQEPPYPGQNPPAVFQIGDFYILITGNGLEFTNGYLRLPLSHIPVDVDPEDLTWLKRTASGDAWEDLGGVIDGDYFTNTIPFDSFSEFSFGRTGVLTYPTTAATGWNLIGLPLDVFDYDFKALYPGAIDGTLYAFDGSYQSKTELEPGIGYWLRFSEGETVDIIGVAIEELTLDLSTGWNMISGPSGMVAVASIVDPEELLIQGTLYGFDGSYQLSDVLAQGKGYWIRASGSGEIGMSISEGVEVPASIAKTASWSDPLREFDRIEISNSDGIERSLYFGNRLPEDVLRESYSLPPLPPGGAFDVRFSDGYYVSEADEMVILLQGNAYPLEMKLYSATPDATIEYIVTELTQEGEGTEYRVGSGESIEIADDGIQMIQLRRLGGMTERSLPTRYSLSQNYPNPFNPSTTILYALPEATHVKLEVYNMLGQRVKVLIEETQEAGYYGVVFDANQLPSGVYIYRIKAGEFVDVKKLVLIK
jgi:ligand-binding sensor domain-containing protein